MPAEAWILCGVVDGAKARPAAFADVCGMPHLLRQACALADAGARRVLALWLDGTEPAPDVGALATDPRLGETALEPHTGVPEEGADGDTILVLRSDRVVHRQIPSALARARGDGAPAGVSMTV